MSQRPSGPPISEQQLAGLPADVRQLVRTVIDYDETRIQDLEFRLGRNPQNSSLPPSSEHPHAKQLAPQRKPSGRKRGGQQGHSKNECSWRHAVIWHKLSFGTQSASGSRFVETLLSVIETCRQQKRNVFAFATEAVQAYFNGHPAPKLSSGV